MVDQQNCWCVLPYACPWLCFSFYQLCPMKEWVGVITVSDIFNRSVTFHGKNCASDAIEALSNQHLQTSSLIIRYFRLIFKITLGHHLSISWYLLFIVAMFRSIDASNTCVVLPPDNIFSTLQVPDGYCSDQNLIFNLCVRANCVPYYPHTVSVFWKINLPVYHCIPYRTVVV